MYNIMIVDDEAAIRENLPSLLDFNLLGYEIICSAKNGTEALNKLEEYPIDLIILDSKMPEMDGMQFLEALSSTKYKDVKIIILSGYSDFHFAKQAIKYNVKSYLTKPVDEDELSELLIEIKKELDARNKLSITKNQEEVALVLKIIYNTNSKISNLEDYSVLTVLPMHFEEKEEQSTYDITANILDKAFGKSCFYYKGFVYSLLINSTAFKSKEDVEAFINEIDSKFKEKNLKAEFLYSNSLTKGNGEPFNAIFDKYIDENLTQLFYKNEEKADFGEAHLLHAHLSSLMEEIQHVDKDKLPITLKSFFKSIKEARLSFGHICDITEKIFYMLENIILSKSNEKNTVIEKINLLDSDLFIDFVAWCKLISAQIIDTVTFQYEANEKLTLGRCTEIVDYVKSNFDKPITIKDVSAKFYLNSSYLGRVFKKTTGESFNKYINNLRIKKAKQMLTQSDVKIYEISDSLGYSESKYFIAKFTQIVGVTPGEFRKEFYKQ